ncbi:hypothetical protein NLJ89_g4683 [Agrocybe chaxingu]|uniref:Uncharacterized protein n=1 Tax=Agrocybe chaxingu TaxID=84603 RepID=A0A9W8K2L2_9AGAR|nr:hypothetical protein NLJ89_g4683 [Agrocybe chaxingu]
MMCYATMTGGASILEEYRDRKDNRECKRGLCRTWEVFSPCIELAHGRILSPPLLERLRLGDMRSWGPHLLGAEYVLQVEKPINTYASDDIESV